MSLKARAYEKDDKYRAGIPWSTTAVEQLSQSSFNMTSSQTSVMTSAGEIGLPAVRRYITTHDEAGKPAFDTGVDEDVPWISTPLGGNLALLFTTRGFPIPLSND